MRKTVSEIKTQLVLGVKVLKLVFEASPKWASFYFGTTLISSIVPTFGFYLGKLTIDAILARDITLVLLYAATGLGINTVNSIFNNLSGFGYNIMKDYLNRYSTEKVLLKSAELDLAYFENPKFHDQLEKVQREISYRPQQAMDLVVETVSSIAGAISLSVLLFQLSIWAPIILVALSIPRFIFRLKHAYWTFSITDSRSPFNRKIGQIIYLLTHKDSATEVKVFNLKNFALNIFNKLNDQFANENKALAKKLTIYSSFLDLLGNLSYYGLSIFAAIQTIFGQLTLGDLTMITGAIRQYQSVLQGIFTYMARFYENNLFLQHYFSFIELRPTITNSTHPTKINISKPLTIEFKNVSFGYEPEKLILKNVNLKISDAKNFALVGENGAGKTTLVKLILRLYDVTSGQILINGVDIKEIDLINLRQNLGTIFQDFMKYEMTVKENIGFGKIDKINDTKGIIEAAKLAGADEFIETFPDKYDTMLGKYFQKGEELSGGQWQKIALARAFFSDAPVLIMDEPTASLDPKSEYDVFRNLISHTTHKSLILISHRFSTVRLADEIIVLDKGQIVEQGSHEKLMELNGKYAKLYNLQAKWYK
jgi:ATP-binding cassette subfamily B protein